MDVFRKKWNEENGVAAGDDPMGQHSIIVHVAQEFQRHGAVLDAVELYDLALEKTAVLELLTVALAERLPKRWGADGAASRIFEKCNEVEARQVYITGAYTEPNEAAYKRLWWLLRVLQCYAEFFDCAARQEWGPALDTLGKAWSQHNAHYIPLHASQLQTALASFAEMDDKIKRNLGDLLVGAMRSLEANFAAERQIYERPKYQTQQTTMASLEAIKNKMHTLLAYSSGINFELPGSIYSDLAMREGRCYLPGS